MKDREKKSQHFVPKAYLAAWVDPACPPGQSYLWAFDTSTGIAKAKGPQNLFVSKDFYTIKMPDGARDLRIENGLQNVEQGIVVLRQDFLEKRRPIPLVRHAKLMAFVSAMGARTPSFRDHHRSSWEKVVKIGEELEKRVAEMQPAEKRRLASMTIPSSGPKMTLEQVKELAAHPIQNMLPAILQSEVPLLLQMQLTVFIAPHGSSFITSDAPATRYDPEAHRRPIQFRGPGLGFKTVEVVLPMSPKIALLIHHGARRESLIRPVLYRDVSPEVVAEVNRRTFAFAKETVVAHHNTFDPQWGALHAVVDG